LDICRGTGGFLVTPLLSAAGWTAAATERTDHTVANDLMTAIWSHGQRDGDTPGLGQFYRPDELKYHAANRGTLTVNFHGLQRAIPPHCLLACTANVPRILHREAEKRTDFLLCVSF